MNRTGFPTPFETIQHCLLSVAPASETSRNPPLPAEPIPTQEVSREAKGIQRTPPSLAR